MLKKAAQIADLMTEEDIAADLKVLREAKKATHHVFDTKTKKLKKVPDHKTRLAATTLSRAYHEGRSIEKRIVAHGDITDFAGLLEKARQSHVFRELEAAESLQKAVEGKEILEELRKNQREEENRMK